jgi:hypothetical protein
MSDSISANGLVLAEVGVWNTKVSNYHKSTIEAEMLMIPRMPPFWQTPVISSLSFKSNF